MPQSTQLRGAPCYPGPGFAPRREGSVDQAAPQILPQRVARLLGTLAPPGQRERERCAQLRQQIDPRGHLLEVLDLRAPLLNPTHPVRLVPSQEKPIPEEEISVETPSRSPSPPPLTARPPAESLRPLPAHGKLRPPPLSNPFQHNRFTRAASDNRFTRAASDEAPASIKIHWQPPRFTSVDEISPERMTRAASDEAPASFRIRRQPGYLANENTHLVHEPSTFRFVDDFCPERMSSVPVFSPLGTGGRFRRFSAT